jgi:hypothetical protein
VGPGAARNCRLLLAAYCLALLNGESHTTFGKLGKRIWGKRILMSLSSAPAPWVFRLPWLWGRWESKPLSWTANASPGQGENKKAIGGIRATHSDLPKFSVPQVAGDIFHLGGHVRGQHRVAEGRLHLPRLQGGGGKGAQGHPSHSEEVWTEHRLLRAGEDSRGGSGD